MKINITQFEEILVGEFARSGDGSRMYLQDPLAFVYPAVGWCPHLEVQAGECIDCSLVIESSEED